MRTVGVGRQQQRGTNAKGGFARIPRFTLRSPIAPVFPLSSIPTSHCFPFSRSFLLSHLLSISWGHLDCSPCLSLSWTLKVAQGRPVGPGYQAWTSQVHSFTLDSELVGVAISGIKRENKYIPSQTQLSKKHDLSSLCGGRTGCGQGGFFSPYRSRHRLYCWQ